MRVERISGLGPGATLRLPFFGSAVQAGFPSPADDYVARSLSLNELLIQHPAATYFCRASGNSLIKLGIFDGDILIVDRALQAADGDLVIAAVDGELTCKILDKHGRRLLSANPDYPPIDIPDDGEAVIEGVVINSIRMHRVRAR